MSIVLRFELPFSLNVEGTYQLKALHEAFEVDLATHLEPKPQFPGAESVERLAIFNDESSILSHTKVTVRYIPASGAPLDPADYSKQVAEIAVVITNTLLSALRIAFYEYHIDYVYSPDKLGPIHFDVPPLNGGKRFSGFYDGLQGGITMQQASRSGPQAAPFAQALITGASLSPAKRPFRKGWTGPRRPESQPLTEASEFTRGTESERPRVRRRSPVPVPAGGLSFETDSKEILFNAKRYLLRGDRRMALANLAISFEVGLADRLAQVAIARGDAVLEAEIAKAALNDLGTGLAARTLGVSFAKRSAWGNRFHEVFEWLRVARNGVLHKAQLALSYEGQTRDFADKTELQLLFNDRDWFMGKLDQAIARVLAGNSAVP